MDPAPQCCWRLTLIDRSSINDYVLDFYIAKIAEHRCKPGRYAVSSRSRSGPKSCRAVNRPYRAIMKNCFSLRSEVVNSWHSDGAYLDRPSIHCLVLRSFHATPTRYSIRTLYVHSKIAPSTIYPRTSCMNHTRVAKSTRHVVCAGT